MVAKFLTFKLTHTRIIITLNNTKLQKTTLVMQLRQPIKGYNGLKKHSMLCRKRVSPGLSFTKTSWTMEADTTHTYKSTNTYA